jgi:CheY-like chemotaxis protein
MEGSINVSSDTISYVEITVNIPTVISTLIEKNKSISPILKSLSDTKLNILCVDDSKINIKIIRRFLLKMNLNCDVSYDGFEAIKKYKATKYDLVFMDISMPCMSGIECRNKIHEYDKNCYVIATTGTETEDLSDFFHVLIKPIKLTDIFYIIAKFKKSLI